MLLVISVDGIVLMNVKNNMKRKLKLLVSLVSVFTLASCQGDAVTKHSSAQEIELVDSIVYEFSENMSYSKDYVQYIPGETNDMLSFLEDRKNIIYFYNAKTGEFCDSIKLDREGSKGVGRIQGYFYQNDDSIFTYQYGTGICRLVNRNSEIGNTYNLFDVREHAKDTIQLYGFPYLETLTPMLMMDRKVVIPTSYTFETNMENESNSSVTMLYDLMTDSVSHYNAYPKTYLMHDWGGGFYYRMVKMCKGLDKNTIILSFSADSRLWEFNLSTHVLTPHDAAIKSIQTLKPFNEEKEKLQNNAKDAVKDWYYAQDNYEGVFSDPYRSLYYRIGRLAVEETPSDFNNKGVVIAAYDRDFNYLGETILPDSEVYDTFNAYVGRKGLNIHLWRPLDEDHWMYYTYALKK